MKKKTMVDLMAYFLTFVGVQIVCGIVATLLCGGESGELSPTVMVVASSVGSVITIAFYAWQRWAVVSGRYIQTRPWFTLFWVACLTLGSMLPISFIGDLCGASMPASTEQMFAGIMSNDLGYVAVGVLAPVAEEMVFRGALLRRMLEALGYRRRWVCIAATALLFAIAHGNMAQGIGAFVMGLMLGWMYTRTGSMVPGIVFHWVNNTASFLLYRLFPSSATQTLTEFYGGDTKRVAIALVCSLMIFCAALYQLRLRLARPANTPRP